MDRFRFVVPVLQLLFRVAAHPALNAAGSRESTVRNDRGQRVAPGVYFARLRVGEASTARKVVLR